MATTTPRVGDRVAFVDDVHGLRLLSGEVTEFATIGDDPAVRVEVDTESSAKGVKTFDATRRAAGSSRWRRAR